MEDSIIPLIPDEVTVAERANWASRCKHSFFNYMYAYYSRGHHVMKGQSKRVLLVITPKIAVEKEH